MGGIRIEGSSGNVADATAAGNLKVQLPTTVSQMGGLRMFSENDDGAITGVPNVKSPETSLDYRLRVGMDQILDHQTWRETYLSSSYAIHKYGTWATGIASVATSPYSTGYLQLGTSGTINSSGYAGIRTRRQFTSVSVSAALACEQTVMLPFAVGNGTTVEFGFGKRSGSGADDGVFFRITSTGMYGIHRASGTETSTALMLVPNINQWYSTAIAWSDKEIQFWVNDIAYALPITGLAYSAASSASTVIGWYSSISIAAAPTSEQRVLVGAYTVSVTDAHPTVDAKLNNLLNGGGLHGQPGQSAILPITFTQNTQPAAVTLTALTSPATNSLGGLFTLPSSITPSNSDYPIFSYLVSNNTWDAKSLVITGLRISELCVSSAITGGPLVFQWGIAYGTGSAGNSSLDGFNTGAANMDFSTTPRHVAWPLGYQSIPASSSVGFLTQAIDVSFGDAPLIIKRVNYFTVMLRIPFGTAMTAGTICGAVSVRGYWI